MKQPLVLNVTSRDHTGRSSSRRLRKVNRIPAILYGKHTSPEKLSVEGPEFIRLLKAVAGRAVMIELQSPDKPEKALSFLQEVQRDPITDRYLHADFREVKADETFEIRVRLLIVGEAYGVKKQGAVLETPTQQIRIRCLPKDLPPAIEVDVTELKMGETIHIGEIKTLPGVEFLDNKDQAVVSCVEPVAEIAAAVVAAPTAAAGAAAPAAGAAGAAAPAADGKTPAPAAGDAKAAAPAKGGDAKAAAPAKAGAAPAKPAKK